MTTKTPRLRIGQIRDAIGAACHSRHWLTGGTREEFKRQNVGPELQAKVAMLRALDIPPRFAADIERRDSEIKYCEQVIERWNQARAEVEQPKADQPHKHVWLGGPVCVTCGAPFVAANRSTH